MRTHSHQVRAVSNRTPHCGDSHPEVVAAESGEGVERTLGIVNLKVELFAISLELMDTRPALGAGVDVPAGQVVLRAIVATTQDEASLDDRYGVDVVRLQADLVPLASTSR